MYSPDELQSIQVRPEPPTYTDKNISKWTGFQFNMKTPSPLVSFRFYVSDEDALSFKKVNVLVEYKTKTLRFTYFPGFMRNNGISLNFDPPVLMETGARLAITTKYRVRKFMGKSHMLTYPESLSYHTPINNLTALRVVGDVWQPTTSSIIAGMFQFAIGELTFDRKILNAANRFRFPSINIPRKLKLFSVGNNSHGYLFDGTHSFLLRELRVSGKNLTKVNFCVGFYDIPATRVLPKLAICEFNPPICIRPFTIISVSSPVDVTWNIYNTRPSVINQNGFGAEFFPRSKVFSIAPKHLVALELDGEVLMDRKPIVSQQEGRIVLNPLKRRIRQISPVTTTTTTALMPPSSPPPLSLSTTPTTPPPTIRLSPPSPFSSSSSPPPLSLSTTPTTPPPTIRLSPPSPSSSSSSSPPPSTSPASSSSPMSPEQPTSSPSDSSAFESWVLDSDDDVVDDFEWPSTLPDTSVNILTPSFLPELPLGHSEGVNDEFDPFFERSSKSFDYEGLFKRSRLESRISVN